jgi:hypothetical protein
MWDRWAKGLCACKRRGHGADLVLPREHTDHIEALVNGLSRSAFAPGAITVVIKAVRVWSIDRDGTQTQAKDVVAVQIR